MPVTMQVTVLFFILEMIVLYFAVSVPSLKLKIILILVDVLLVVVIGYLFYKKFTTL